VLVKLGYLDLSIAWFLLVGVTLLSILMQLDVAKKVLIAALRMVLQLLLVGQILKSVFLLQSTWALAGVILVMTCFAAREIIVRQDYHFLKRSTNLVGPVALAISTLVITFIALRLIIGITPWYRPQYLIPIMGMALGNTMNGIAIALHRFLGQVDQKRGEIMERLALGETPALALLDIRRESINAGIIPMINMMSVAGIVALPGMMTGQILSGTSPVEAVKYQIMIILLVATSIGFGTMMVIHFTSKALFDQRERLCWERLKPRG
jgi:putative ABC transport system permease protein